MAFVRSNPDEAFDAGLDPEELDAFFQKGPSEGWGEALFTGLNATIFLLLMAAVAAAAILYAHGA